MKALIYNELRNAFRQGGWGDLQRPLPDKTEVVKAFKPAASFNLGVGAAAADVSITEAIVGGGAYNIGKNWNYPKAEFDLFEFGNHPDNPPHIREGAEQFSKGTLRKRLNENKAPSPERTGTATQFGLDVDGHRDNSNKAVAERMRESQSLMADQRSEYWRGPKAEALQQEYRDLIEERDRHKPRPGDLDFSPFTMVP